MNSLFILAILVGVVAIYGHPGRHGNMVESSAMEEIENQNIGSSDHLKYIDIKTLPEEANDIPEGAQGAIIKNTRNLWPNKLVWYSFDSAFTVASRSKVRAALKGIEKVTCIRFKEYVVGRMSAPVHYVRVFSGSGCWSYIGYARFGGTGYQDMSLRESGCVNEKIIQHEFIHALGAYHEQARNDRDDYINVFKDNMVDGAWAQFQKQTLATIDSRGVAYDGQSIMHYSNYAFSKNGQPTMQWKANPSYQLGGRKLSESDIKQLNLLYSCGTKPPTTTTSTTTTPTTTTTTSTTPTTTMTTPTTTTTTTTITPKTKTTPTTTTPGECKNKQSYCKDIPKYFCEYDMVMKNCPERCGLCDKKTTPTTTTTTTTTTPTTTTMTITNPTAITKTKGPGGNGCIDVSIHCSKTYRNCDNHTYQRRCRKACNQCHKPLPPKCQGLSDSSPNCSAFVIKNRSACRDYQSHCQLSCCLRDRN